MNVMTYGVYASEIEYDAEDEIFVGRIAGIRDGVSFHADSVQALREAFHEAVDDYVETCRTIGREPQRSYSGKMMFRVDPAVHADAARVAERAGKSLNQWAADVLSKAAAGRS